MTMASIAATTSLAVSPIIQFHSSKSSVTKIPKCQSLNFGLLLKQNHRVVIVKASAPGLYSADQFELTSENVDKVLDNVRPYLIADGGDVDVVSVENGVVSLKLRGACESCPSSTTTMKLGIERVLKEKFGDAIKDICQVYDEQISDMTTVEAVNGHLDILRPAIKNYGGSVEVLSIVDGNCIVKYNGLESIGSGIKAAIKERFPDIVNVELTN